MEPTIDPATGKPTEGADVKTSPSTVSVEEFNQLKGKLDAFEKGFGGQFGQQQQAAPTPSAPSGPSFDDQISNLDNQIKAFDAQIDEAVADGKPVSSLFRKRDTLTSEKTRLTVKYQDLDPALSQGIQAIDYLTDKVTRNDMPHLDVVKDSFETNLRDLPANQRMNPQVRQAAYKIAVGENIDKILEAKKEEVLRSAAAEPAGDVSGENGRGKGAGGKDDIPTPQEVLGTEAMQALKTKGITVDEYYKKLGYEDWSDFYEKKGKGFFGEGE